MAIEPLALHNIFRVLAQLSEQLKANRDPQTRLELMKQMRMLLADADKIVSGETGEN
jgi:hypothetical protein